MRTTKYLLFTFCLLLISGPMLAQGMSKSERAERLKALKIGYITEQLSLTPDEAKGFWPIYDSYEAKMQLFRKEAKLERAEARIYWDEMTDADADKMIDEYLERQQKELDLRKSTTEQLKKVLPSRKVAQFWASEAKFKARVLQELKSRNMQQGGQGPGPGPGPRGGGRGR